jgi:hypothetical protein
MSCVPASTLDASPVTAETPSFTVGTVAVDTPSVAVDSPPVNVDTSYITGGTPTLTVDSPSVTVETPFQVSPRVPFTPSLASNISRVFLFLSFYLVILLFLACL